MVNDIDKVDLNSIGSQALLSVTNDQDSDFYSECELLMAFFNLICWASNYIYDFLILSARWLNFSVSRVERPPEEKRHSRVFHWVAGLSGRAESY